jgi:hypothetical protein
MIALGPRSLVRHRTPLLGTTLTFARKRVSFLMKQINSLSDLEQTLRAETIIPVGATKLDSYVDVFYSCGCGNQHNVARYDCLSVIAAKRIKVLLRCENKYYTFIQIKGLFRVKTQSFWTFEADLVERDEGSEPYRFMANSKSWIDFFTKDKAREMMLGRKAGLIPH